MIGAQIFTKIKNEYFLEKRRFNGFNDFLHLTTNNLTDIPFFRNSSAVAKPIPLAPPVMIAVFPFNDIGVEKMYKR